MIDNPNVFLANGVANKKITRVTTLTISTTVLNPPSSGGGTSNIAFLQGTAGGGRIDVFVEAVGFSANLTLRTSGNKQTVQISSKGDIRGVSITLVKS